MTREEALEELDSLLIPRDGEQDKLADAFEMAIKALEQEPCEDAISREFAIDTLCEGLTCYDCSFNKWGNNDMGCLLKERIRNMPPATPKAEPCEDAISRQAALNSLIDNTHLDGYDLAEALDAIENKEKLPSVTPKQRTGRWEEIKSLWGGKWEMIDNYKCSVCGELEVSGNDYKFCPNCGAKMESEEQA